MQAQERAPEAHERARAQVLALADLLSAGAEDVLDDMRVERILREVLTPEGTWAGESNVLITYDAEGRRVRDLTQYWDPDSESWGDMQEVTYSYDAEGRLVSMLTRVYDEDAGAWQDAARVTFTYGDGGEVESVLLESNAIGSWQPFMRMTLTYSGGKLTESLVETDLTFSGNLETDYRALVSYEGEDVVAVQQNWDEASESWINEERSRTKNYEPSLLDLFTLVAPDDLVETWDAAASAWVSESRTVTTFDSEDLPLEQVSEKWDVAGQVWVPESRLRFGHDGTLLVTIEEEDYVDGAWPGPSARQTLFYGPAVATEEGRDLPDRFTLSPNFPNPFNPATTIRFALSTSEHVTLEVVDATGRLVATLFDGAAPAGEHQVTFRADGLPSGLYLYRLRTTSYHEVRTMMLVK